LLVFLTSLFFAWHLSMLLGFNIRFCLKFDFKFYASANLVLKPQIP